MTPQQVAHIRSSFNLVAPGAAQVAALFYQHLFAVDPSLRALFKGELSQQGERLMQMIGAAVGLLDQPERLVPVLRTLGARHRGYGVRAAHYDSVGTALLRTLRDGLGVAFTPAVAEAWATMYGLVAREMQRAEEPATA
ncbi:MAG: globin family protein [Pseudomonadota bacterium]